MFEHPVLISYTNYGTTASVKIGLKTKIYKYTVPASAWIHRLQNRKKLNFKDLNKIKEIGRLVMTEEL